MKIINSLLTNALKKRIVSLVERDELLMAVALLDKISTAHAGTAKTKDKRFVIRKISESIEDSVHADKRFFEAGLMLCNRNSDNAKEIGVSLIWKGYRYNKKITVGTIVRISDDCNWEVREYAAGAFIELLRNNHELHRRIMRLAKHKSENVRRAVLFSALAFKNAEHCGKGFGIIESMLSERSEYVRRNLGPFILGSHFGNKLPVQTLKMLKKWGKCGDAATVSNVVMSFASSFGSNYPKEALEVIASLPDKTKEQVLKPVESALKHIGKRHPQMVSEFRNARKN